MNAEKLDVEETELHHKIRASLELALDRFGNEIAKSEGYTEVAGVDALRLYLLRKYGWTPKTVRGLSLEDLRFILDVEWKRGP